MKVNCIFLQMNADQILATPIHVSMEFAVCQQTAQHQFALALPEFQDCFAIRLLTFVQMFIAKMVGHVNRWVAQALRCGSAFASHSFKENFVSNWLTTLALGLIAEMENVYVVVKMITTVLVLLVISVTLVLHLMRANLYFAKTAEIARIFMVKEYAFVLLDTREIIVK